MLYYFSQWLDRYDVPGAGMFSYVSFRALMAILLALIISTVWGGHFIQMLKNRQLTEVQRDARNRRVSHFSRA